MTGYTHDEVEAIAATWHHAHDEAQVARDAAEARGEEWARGPIHHDLVHQHWRSEAGTDAGDQSAQNYATLKWAHDHLHPDLYRRGQSRAFPELLEDILTFVQANPQEYAQGIWGVRQRQLRPEQSANARNHGRPNSMRVDHLVHRIRYHMARLPLGHDSGWWCILVGAETAVTAPWATCWPHVFQAVAHPRYDPHQTPETRARKTHSLIDTVGKVVAQALKPPRGYSVWEDVLIGRRYAMFDGIVLEPGARVLVRGTSEDAIYTADRLPAGDAADPATDKHIGVTP